MAWSELNTVGIVFKVTYGLLNPASSCCEQGVGCNPVWTIFFFGCVFHCVNNVVAVKHANHCVDSRTPVEHFCAVALNKTTCSDDSLDFAMFLHGNCFINHFDRFFFRGLKEPACIDDDGICIVMVRHNVITSLHQRCEHLLTVDKVLWAT